MIVMRVMRRRDGCISIAWRLGSLTARSEDADLMVQDFGGAALPHSVFETEIQIEVEGKDPCNVLEG